MRKKDTDTPNNFQGSLRRNSSLEAGERKEGVGDQLFGYFQKNKYLTHISWKKKGGSPKLGWRQGNLVHAGKIGEEGEYPLGGYETHAKVGEK